ncbi:MAG: prealbumin-like fold domain-containing protein, partial [Coriobacteriia bacterium]|nr:prealbumin-like fold domain-containing protein [Coriobacteriia bacterium]
MLHDVKRKPVLFLLGFLALLALVVGTEILLEDTAQAEASHDPPIAALADYVIIAGDDGKEIKAGTFEALPEGTAPREGEVIVGKQVVHQMYWTDEILESEETSYAASEQRPNGLINVSLSLIGEYLYPDGRDNDPVLPLVHLQDAPAGQEDTFQYVYAEVVDDLGDFIPLSIADLPSGTGYGVRFEQNYTAVNGAVLKNALIWEIYDQTIILTGTPLEISYTLRIDPDTIADNTEYDTGRALGRFKPNPYNPKYWQLVSDPVIVNGTYLFSPNAGQGGRISDSWLEDEFKVKIGVDSNGQDVFDIVRIRISFPGQQTIANNAALDSHGMPINTGSWKNWNTPVPPVNPAVVTFLAPLPNTSGLTSPISTATKNLSWHLQGQYGTGPNWKLTVQHPFEPGNFVEYLLPSNGAGNFTGPLQRVIWDTRLVQVESDDIYTFNWLNDYLISDIGTIGRITLRTDRTLTPFNLGVMKDYGNDPKGFHFRWGNTDDTVHEVVLRTTIEGEELYLSFDTTASPDGNSFAYVWRAFSSTGTPISFSVNKPAQLIGVPAFGYADADLYTPLLDYVITELDAWAGSARKPEIRISYSFDDLMDAAPNTTGQFDPTRYGADAGRDTTVTVTNEFQEAAFANLYISKYLEGTPADHGVGPNSPFTVMVWDNDGWNGPTSPQFGNFLLFRPHIEDPNRPDLSEPYGYTEGTLFCAGNMGEHQIHGIASLEQYLEVFNAFVESHPDGYAQALEAWMRDGSPDPWFWSDKDWQRTVLNEANQLSDNPLTVLTQLTITQAKGLGVSNLWPGSYSVMEVKNDGTLVPTTDTEAWYQQVRYSPTLSGQSSVGTQVNIAALESARAEVVNTFTPIPDNLALIKNLIGRPDTWGIDENVPFDVRIWNQTKDRIHLFRPHESHDVNDLNDLFWEYVGTSLPDGSDKVARPDLVADGYDIDADPGVQGYFQIYAGYITVVEDFFKHVTEVVYVDEYNLDDLWTIRILFTQDMPDDPDGPRRVFPITSAAPSPIPIFNSYLLRGNLRGILTKELSGDYAAFGIDEETVFDIHAESLRREFDGDTLIADYSGNEMLFLKMDHVVASINGERAQHLHLLGEHNPETGVYYVYITDEGFRSGGVPEYLDVEEFASYEDMLEFLDTTPYTRPSTGIVYQGYLRGQITSESPDGELTPTETRESLMERIVNHVTFSKKHPVQICRLTPWDILLHEKLDGEENPFMEGRIVVLPAWHDVPSADGGQAVAIQINNYFDGSLAHLGSDQLSIQKTLSGDTAGWSVEATSTFMTEVTREGDESGNKLAFVKAPYSPFGTRYIYFGEYDGRDYRTPDGGYIDYVAALDALNKWLEPTVAYTEADIVTEIPVWAAVDGRARLTHLPHGQYVIAETTAVDAGLVGAFSSFRSPDNGVATLDAQTPHAFMTLNNIFAGPGDIILNKSLAGYPGHWDVSASTPFSAELVNEAGQKLVFDQDEALTGVPGAYAYIGYLDGTTFVPADASYDEAAGSPTTEIAFSETEPALLTNVPAYPVANYTVRELSLDNVYATSIFVGEDLGGTPASEDAEYQFEHARDTELILTFVNQYLYKERATMLIEKQITQHRMGDAAAFGISDTTVFDAWMENPETGRKLLFVAVTADSASSTYYRFVGEVDANVTETGGDANVYLLQWHPDTAQGETTNAQWTIPGDDAPSGKFSDNRFYTWKINISGIKSASMGELPPGTYRVDEVFVDDAEHQHTVTYHAADVSSQTPQPLANGEHIQTTVRNHYDGSVLYLGDSSLHVEKLLEGYPAAWDVSDATTFTASLYNSETGRVIALLPVFSAPVQPSDPRGGMMSAAVQMQGYHYIGEYADGVYYDNLGRVLDIEHVLEVFSNLSRINKSPAYTTADIVYSFEISQGMNPKLQIHQLPAGNYHVLETDDQSMGEHTISYRDSEANPLEGALRLEASDEATITVVNSFISPLLHQGSSQLGVRKTLDGDWASWGIETSTTFYAQVRNAETAESGNVLAFVRANSTVFGSRYIYIGEQTSSGDYVDAAGTALNIDAVIRAINLYLEPEIAATKANITTYLPFWAWYDGVARITDLPAGDYVVTETSDPAGMTGVSYASNRAPSDGTVHLDARGRYRNGFVNITNIFAGPGDVEVYKALTGSPQDWGVSPDTVFSAELQNEAGQTLVFEIGDAALAGDYTYVGYLDGTTLVPRDPTYDVSVANTVTQISFSVNVPARLKSLPAHPVDSYTITEIAAVDVYATSIYEGTDISGDADSSTVSFSFDLVHDEVYTLTVVNDYLSKQRAEMTIDKTIDQYRDGDAAAFGISAETTFAAWVENVATGRKLVFEQLEDSAAGRRVYRLVGEVDASGMVYFLAWNAQAALPESSFASYGYPDAADGVLADYPQYTTVVDISADAGADLVDMIPGSYLVDEVFSDSAEHHHSVTYVVVGSEEDPSRIPPALINAGQIEVEVTNSYDGSVLYLGDEELIVEKRLEGYPEPWGVSIDTNFTATLYNADTDRAIVLLPAAPATAQLDLLPPGPRPSGGMTASVTVSSAGDYYYMGETDGTNYYDSAGNVLDMAHVLEIFSQLSRISKHPAYTMDDLLTSFEICAAADGFVHISQLPAGDYYLVEVDDQSVGTHSISYLDSNEETLTAALSITASASGQSSDNRITVVNDFASPLTHLGPSQLGVRKMLDGDTARWDIDSTTIFTATVVNTDRADADNVLAFVKARSSAFGGTRYIYVGEKTAGGTYVDASGAALNIEAVIAAINLYLTPEIEAAVADITTVLPFWAWYDGMARITNLPAGSYEVIETSSPAGLLSAAYASNRAPSEGQIVLNAAGRRAHGFVTVTNTFAGAGDVLLSKEVTGTPSDWNVDGNTVFEVAVENSEGQTVLFDTTLAGSGQTYSYVGYLDADTPVYADSSYEPAAGQPVAVVSLSANAPALLTGLPAVPAQTYTVTEQDSVGALDSVYATAIYAGEALEDNLLSASTSASFSLNHTDPV